VFIFIIIIIIVGCFIYLFCTFIFILGYLFCVVVKRKIVECNKTHDEINKRQKTMDFRHYYFVDDIERVYRKQI